VFETDADRARAIAREGMATYLPLANYQSSWRLLGFDDDDFVDGGSDQLVDRVVAWGDDAAIAARVRAHLDAGGDHVCVQVLKAAERTDFPRAEWRALAPALGGHSHRPWCHDEWPVTTACRHRPSGRTQAKVTSRAATVL
jgi:probable F420-dependent oxidoreductase